MVSVIIPVYNAEKYIELCVESLLNQTYTDYELIFIDDCSVDGSYAILEKYSQKDARVKLYRNLNNIGVAENRNMAIGYATGEYIAIMDDDDIIPIDRLQVEVDFLNNHPQIDAVGGYNREINEKGEYIEDIPSMKFIDPIEMRCALFYGDILPNGSMMFRRNCIERYNIRFRDKAYGVDDYYFWCELSYKGAICKLPKILLNHRTNEQNLGTKMLKEKQDERIRLINEMHQLLWECMTVDGDYRYKEEVLKIVSDEGHSSWRYALVMSIRKKTLLQQFSVEYRNIMETYVNSFIRNNWKIPVIMTAIKLLGTKRYCALKKRIKRA